MSVPLSPGSMIACSSFDAIHFFWHFTKLLLEKEKKMFFLIMSVWLSSNCAWTSSFVLSCDRLTLIMWINWWHHSFHISVPYPTSDSSSLTSRLLVKRPNACKPNSPHFLAVSCCNQCKGLFLFSSVYLIVLPSLSHIRHSDPLWGSYSKCSRTYLLPLRGASIAAWQSLCRGGCRDTLQ